MLHSLVSATFLLLWQITVSKLIYKCTEIFHWLSLELSWKCIVYKFDCTNSITLFKCVFAYLQIRPHWPGTSVPYAFFLTHQNVGYPFITVKQKSNTRLSGIDIYPCSEVSFSCNYLTYLIGLAIEQEGTEQYFSVGYCSFSCKRSLPIRCQWNSNEWPLKWKSLGRNFL